MCEKLQLLGEISQTPTGALPLDHTGGLPIRRRLCFSNDVYSAPKNQKHGFLAVYV